MSLMSVILEISCDECGEWTPVRRPKVNLARRALRAKRWGVATNPDSGARMDLCPACFEKMRESLLKEHAARQRARVAK